MISYQSPADKLCRAFVLLCLSMTGSIILFLGISGGEIFIILLFVLIFFGADQIPGIARTMGRTIRQVKDATQDIQRDLEDATRSAQREVKETRRSLDQAFDEPKGPTVQKRTSEEQSNSVKP